ncbi:hypothetical protein MN608_04137 [Microdochium nivale]|nr:hypothetical protein MN608_04137 [Microdochium nivale]
MNSPPPELPGSDRSGGKTVEVKHKDMPVTPIKPHAPPRQQLLTPDSPTANNGRLLVIWNTDSVKDRMGLAAKNRNTNNEDPFHTSNITINNDADPEAPPASSGGGEGEKSSNSSSSSCFTAYDFAQRDRDMASVQSWLRSSSTPEQRRHRSDAVVAALFQSCLQTSYPISRRPKRSRYAESIWSSSSDEDDEVEKEDQDVKHVTDRKRQEEVGLNSEADLKDDRKEPGPPAEDHLNENDIITHIPAPQIGHAGIENKQDLDVVMQFRETHNVAVASLRAGRVVLPYCSGRQTDRLSRSSRDSPTGPGVVEHAVMHGGGPQHRIVRVPPPGVNPHGTAASKIARRNASGRGGGRTGRTRGTRVNRGRDGKNGRASAAAAEARDTDWTPEVAGDRRACGAAVPERRQGSLRRIAMETAAVEALRGRRRRRGGGGKGGKKATAAQRAMLFK